MALLSFSFGATMPSDAIAQDQFCNDDSRFAPNGIIVELGVRYFRLCGPKNSNFPYNLDPEIGDVQIAIHPKSDLVERYRSKYFTDQYLWGFLKYGDGGYAAYLERQLSRSLTDYGQVSFGGKNYSVFSRSSSNVGTESTPEQAETLPEFGFYVFENKGDTTLPNHAMSCFGDPSGGSLTQYDCFISVEYGGTGAYRVEHRFIWRPNSTLPKFDIDTLPSLVSHLHGLFKFAEVTNGLDEFSNLPLVEAPEN